MASVPDLDNSEVVRRATRAAGGDVNLVMMMTVLVRSHRDTAALRRRVKAMERRLWHDWNPGT